MLLKPDEPYQIHEGDCIPHLAGMSDHSVSLGLTSVPFPAVFSYTSKLEDIGNSEQYPEMKLHLSWLYRGVKRVLQPGRVFVVHVNQIPRMKRAGGEGLFDFRGFNIRLAERAGLIFEYDWVGRINPQFQALRSRSRELQFAGLESDRANSRGALPDYFLKFTAPGVNEAKVDSLGEVSRNEWIEWAECTWSSEKYVISASGLKSDTLNTEEAKGPDDCRHICPFNLSYLDRLIRLFTNPGEIVLDPFAGIGSVGFVAIRRNRRFYGIELNPLYRKAAIGNLNRALVMNRANEGSLFDALEMEDVPPTGGVAPSDGGGPSGDDNGNGDEAPAWVANPSDDGTADEWDI